MKSKIRFVLILFILVQVLQIVYAQRAYFTTLFNSAYWKDRYQHSQYYLPLTTRLIGDDGAYAYAGDQVIHGADPFSNVIDKQPFGKYIIGLSIVLFHNAAIGSLLLGIGTLFLFYLYSRSLIATALLSVDAMFFSQFWISAMDMAQLFFLLLSMMLIGQPLLSGIALGLFAEIKPPILLPIIIPILFFRMKKVKPIVLWSLGFVIGALSPYIWYMHLGHSIVDVLRVHKFMFTLIRSSTLTPHIGAIFQTIFMGTFPQISSGVSTIVSEWWFVWPTIFVLSLFAMRFRGIWILVFGSLFILCVIPSYPRYLLVLLPFMYLLAVRVVEKNRFFMPLVTIILVFGFIRTAWYVRPSQDAMRSVCLYSYTHQFFADVYEECLDAKSKSQISLSQFRALTEGILLDAQVVSISAKNNGFTYYTRYLGSFTETKTIPWVIEDGQWKIHWKWDLLLNGFQPGYHVVTAIQNGNRGAIIDTMGKTLVDDTDGYVISVDPSHIDSKREQQMLKILSSISSIEKVRLQNAYSENPRPGKAIPLFSTFEPLTPENEKALRSYPGVTITPYRSRLYMGKVGSGDIKNTTYSECCTRIYSSLNYHGIGGPDYTFDAVLSGYDGGTLSIVNEKGETVHTIIQKAPKNGSDVTLPL